MNSMKRVRVVADVTRCCGYGACKEICPEVYQLGQGGLVRLVADIVPEGLEDKAIEGAESCPQEALTIEVIEA
jgi:ferredoxin